jgi:hypothetical protein
MYVVMLGCSCGLRREVGEAHADITAIRDRIAAGMTPGEIRAVFEQQKSRHLRFVHRDGEPVVLIYQVVQESAAKEWLLWVSLNQGHAAAVRIRTNDSPLEHPAGAPGDLVWSQEDQGTPFTTRSPS